MEACQYTMELVKREREKLKDNVALFQELERLVLLPFRERNENSNGSEELDDEEMHFIVNSADSIKKSFKISDDMLRFIEEELESIYVIELLRSYVCQLISGIQRLLA